MHRTAEALLDDANACHDDEPARAAEMLRQIDPAALPATRLPGLAFLFNHVLGEKLAAWPEAHERCGTLLRAAGDAPPPALYRQAAAAARLAGDAAAESRLSDALAAAVGAPAERARDVVALTALMYAAPSLAAPAAAAAVSAALPTFAAPAWAQATPLDAAAAACVNNIASGLVERPAAELQHPAVRAALADTAELAERLWLRAGTWVNHERAAYLRAMAANALDDAAQARAHARRALALLDEHDTEHAESVDRAFLELEHARACRALALHDDALAAQEAADALASQFDDPGLDAWYAKRRAEVGAPARRGI